MRIGTGGGCKQLVACLEDLKSIATRVDRQQNQDLQR